MTASSHALPDYRARIGAFLRSIRTARGVTLKEIGDLAGYGTGAIERMESGHFAASDEMIAAYREIINGDEARRVVPAALMNRKLARAAKAGLLP